MTVETLSNQTSFALSDQAEIILNHRYYLKDTENTVIEDAPILFRRVANAIASVDNQYEVFPEAVKNLSNKFFNMMQNLEFLPNSPTMMAGELIIVPSCGLYFDTSLRKFARVRNLPSPSLPIGDITGPL